MTSLSGKTVLLTGASRGLGVYIARALAKEQATVVCVSRSKSELDTICNEINTFGGKGISIPFDLKNISEIPSLIQQIYKTVGKVDILINNAGIEIRQSFADYSPEEIDSLLKINLLSPMELTRCLLPRMLKQRSGHIVNMASLAGKKGVAYSSIYSASKAALIMWNDAMRQELAGTGVQMSVICPGFVSQVGMFANSNVPAPFLVGTSRPAYVANVVLRAIQQNRAEIIVNSSPITEFLAKLLFAIAQLYLPFADAVYRWIGINKLTKMRVEMQRNRDVSLMNKPI